ncbi:MAG: hypothetical protein WBL74_08425, partial [Novosphingobium sp.]|uniref:hypothetical protein n=1 Tax=Novosphingobium sp. TaxID=1874826 RepID=UPI003C7BA58A
SGAPAAVQDAPQPGPAVVDPALTPPVPITAEPAITAATPGKILPVALPLAVSGQDKPETDQAEAPNPRAQHPVTHSLPLTAQTGKLRAAAQRANAGDKASAKDAEPEPLQLAALIDPAQALAIAPPPGLPESVEHVTPALPQTAQLATPAIPATPAESAAAAQPALARTLLPDAAAPVVRVLSNQAEPQQSTAPQVPVAQVPAGQVATAAPAPPPLTQVRLDVALPEVLRPARVQPARAAPLLAAMPGDELEAPGGAIAASAPVAAAPPVFSSAAPAPLDRPHDFSALIDRLAAAREATAPHSISISLPHAEFGRVQLHFRSEDGALAVSLASADPDFARIAAQAAPPVLALAEARSADHAPGQGLARGEGQAASASQQGSQRGQSEERRSAGHGEAEARFDHLPRSASSAKGRGRSGIFA